MKREKQENDETAEEEDSHEEADGSLEVSDLGDQGLKAASISFSPDPPPTTRKEIHPRRKAPAVPESPEQQDAQAPDDDSDEPFCAKE